MSPTDTTLAEIYKGWETYQSYLTKAVAPLTAEQLTLRAAPNLRTVGELVTHILVVRIAWFHFAAGTGGPEIEPFGTWSDPGAPLRSASDLVNGLEISGKLIHDAINKWTPDELSTPFEARRGSRVRTVTRQWIIWHVVEHDVHHGGELSFTLGMHGLQGLDV